MRSVFGGEVRAIRASDDGKYVDVAVLQDGASNSTRLWAFSDTEGLAVVQVGDVVECETYASAKLSKKGNAYLSVQLRGIHVQQMAAERKLKTA